LGSISKCGEVVIDGSRSSGNVDLVDSDSCRVFIREEHLETAIADCKTNENDVFVENSRRERAACIGIIQSARQETSRVVTSVTVFAKTRGHVYKSKKYNPTDTARVI
jgi:hypothetical protein